MSFLGTKRPKTLKLGIKHRVLKYYQTNSNDDTGLILSILMIWSSWFPNASAMSKLIQHIHVVIYFKACSYSAYPMHSGEPYRTNGLLVFIKVGRAHGFGRGKAISICTRPYTRISLRLRFKFRPQPLWTWHTAQERGDYSNLELFWGKPNSPRHLCIILYARYCNIVNFVMFAFVSIWLQGSNISLWRQTRYRGVSYNFNHNSIFRKVQEDCSRRDSRDCHSSLSTCLICSECCIRL